MHAMKAYWTVQVQLHSLLTWPQTKARWPFKEAEWAPNVGWEKSGIKKKFLTPSRNQTTIPRSPSPYRSHAATSAISNNNHLTVQANERSGWGLGGGSKPLTRCSTRMWNMKNGGGKSPPPKKTRMHLQHDRKYNFKIWKCGVTECTGNC